MAEFPAIGHVALTVRDLKVSVPWYRELIGTDPVLDEDVSAGSFHHTVFLIGGALIALNQFGDRPVGEAFSEFNAGLDHLAFGCATRGELEEWAHRLDSLGIAHGGIVDAPYGSVLSFRDPDNIALEFFAPPG
jgi:glyoxylase I family protein